MSGSLDPPGAAAPAPGRSMAAPSAVARAEDTTPLPAPPPPRQRWAARPSQIPWRHRLTSKLLLATGAFTVVAVTVFTLTENTFRDALLAQTVIGADLFSQTTERAISRSMLENRRDDAHETMRAIGSQPGIERVRMFNREGGIVFSTDPRETGTVVERTSETCTACHAGAQPDSQPVSQIPARGRVRVYETSDHHRAMGLIRPLLNDLRCSSAACHEHAGGQLVLGVLDISVSLEPVDARIATFRRLGVIFTAVSVLVLGGFFLALARKHVVRPVFALVEGTRRVARDELDVEIVVQSKGELGLLAAAFNDMTRSLRRAEEALRELNHSLEQKVEARTSELKRAQSSLIQAEKLSSLGQLSASIAHEINNPLAGILTFAKVLMRQAEHDVPDEARRRVLVKNLSLIQRESQRCSAIVRNLLDFARERSMEMKDIDLNSVVDESIQLIAHQISMLDEKIEKRLLPLPRVYADFGQLRQSVVNVALNALEAMGPGGKLSVATAPTGDGAWVELIISDTGPGIPPENLGRIFDPFFTTKAKGTGLGLSVVYGIIQRHGGTVEAHSEPGHGATFVLRLPAAKTAPV